MLSMLCPFRKETVVRVLRWQGNLIDKSRATQEFLNCVENRCMAYDYNKQTDTVHCKLCNN